VEDSEDTRTDDRWRWESIRTQIPLCERKTSCRGEWARSGSLTSCYILWLLWLPTLVSPDFHLPSYPLLSAAHVLLPASLPLSSRSPCLCYSCTCLFASVTSVAAPASLPLFYLPPLPTPQSSNLPLLCVMLCVMCFTTLTGRLWTDRSRSTA
jgi:hypothetical protein